MNTVVFLDSENIQTPANIARGSKVIYRDKTRQKVRCIHDFALNFVHNKEFYKPDWLQTWAAQTTVQGKTVKEHFIFEGSSLWYLTEFPLYAGASSLPHEGTATILYWIDCLNEIIAQEKPAKIFIQNNDHPFYQLTKEVCASHNMAVAALGIPTKKSLREHLREQKFFTLPYVRARLAVRRATRFLVKRPKEKPPLLILSNHRFSRGPAEKNEFWGSVVSECKKQEIPFGILEYDDIWDSESLRKMISKHRAGTDPYASFAPAYYTNKSARRTRQVARFLNHTWDRLTNDDAITQSMVYRSINIEPFIRKRFAFVFSVLAYVYGDTYALCDSIAHDRKPRVIAMDHEMNIYGLCLMLRKDHKQYRTIALQFESVNTKTCVHRYPALPRIHDEKDPLWRPIADVKCASGPYAAKILVERCQIPQSHIVITGQPRYDTLASKPSVDTATLLTQLGLDPKKKTIVYATKFRMDEEEIWRALQALVKRRHDWQIIFKLAPNNDPQAYAHAISSGPGVAVTRDHKMLDILAASDLLITIHSTVAMEMMCLQKPVLLVDFYNVTTFSYVELGAAYPVTKLADVEHGIEQCLTNEKVRGGLVAGGQRFLSEYLYKQDGKAAQRVVDVLSQQLTISQKK